VPLEDGAAGELVSTHVGREASPLARYRSGDLGRVWTAPCPCGRPGPRIRIEGRRDDMLRVRGVNVHPGAVGAAREEQACVELFAGPDASTALRAFARRRG
jgi:phenylacetate-CoA ligase